MDNKNLQPDVSQKENETRKPVKIPLPSIITKTVTKQALGGRGLLSSMCTGVMQVEFRTKNACPIE
jgi:hypothetical protein